ncbi:hypothetical protein ACH5RR_038554 [Cinchona calisaya]|uniref:Aminotransferase class I/classII large domain-containing protein n=1 Tax=Cinchona calisaya TaxID=153742 RepID=A0ABD2XVL1_9GENT
MKKDQESITSTTRTGGGATTAMRVIVPLQGVVQGRGGLILGSVIPCALFYFFQLYLKRNRSKGGSAGDSPPPPARSPSGTHLQETSSLQRVHSRSSLSSPGGVGGGGGSGGPAPQLASRANSIVKQADGPNYVGLQRVSEDPYDYSSNPHGVIQLGLAENRLSLDLVQEWLEKNAKQSMLGQDLSIRGIATYQPFDGLMELKVAVAGFMSQVMDKSVSFSPSQIVLAAGATPAIEILSFCLADPGNAFLVPSPYYPE